MGVGRFVFTPILPVMVTALSLPAVSTAVIASANYVGYFLGAFILARKPSITFQMTLRIAACVLIISLMAMAWTTSITAYALIRLLAGIASAAMFVCLSQVAADAEASGGDSGYTYAGVGAGIAISGLFVALALSSVPWQGLWYGSALLAVLLTIPAWGLPVTPPHARSGSTQRHEWSQQGVRTYLILLVTYFLEGAGYIIIGTYLVAVADGTLPAIAPWVWVVAGVAAVPSTMVWRYVRSHLTAQTTFVAAYMLQFFSAIIPLLSASAWASLLSAFLFGATFMGITLLSIREAAAAGVVAAPARLTATYGIGQILGPLVAVPLLLDGNYNEGFIVAALILMAATAGSLFLPKQCN
jgi:MFS family permease